MSSQQAVCCSINEGLGRIIEALDAAHLKDVGMELRRSEGDIGGEDGVRKYILKVFNDRIQAHESIDAMMVSLMSLLDTASDLPPSYLQMLSALSIELLTTYNDQVSLTAIASSGIIAKLLHRLNISQHGGSAGPASVLSSDIISVDYSGGAMNSTRAITLSVSVANRSTSSGGEGISIASSRSAMPDSLPDSIGEEPEGRRPPPFLGGTEGGRRYSSGSVDSLEGEVGGSSYDTLNHVAGMSTLGFRSTFRDVLSLLSNNSEQHASVTPRSSIEATNNSNNDSDNAIRKPKVGIPRLLLSMLHEETSFNKTSSSAQFLSPFSSTRSSRRLTTMSPSLHDLHVLTTGYSPMKLKHSTSVASLTSSTNAKTTSRGTPRQTALEIVESMAFNLGESVLSSCLWAIELQRRDQSLGSLLLDDHERHSDAEETDDEGEGGDIKLTSVNASMEEDATNNKNEDALVTADEGAEDTRRNVRLLQCTLLAKCINVASEDQTMPAALLMTIAGEILCRLNRNGDVMSILCSQELYSLYQSLASFSFHVDKTLKERVGMSALQNSVRVELLGPGKGKSVDSFKDDFVDGDGSAVQLGRSDSVSSADGFPWKQSSCDFVAYCKLIFDVSHNGPEVLSILTGFCIHCPSESLVYQILITFWSDIIYIFRRPYLQRYDFHLMNSALQLVTEIISLAEGVKYSKLQSWLSVCLTDNGEVISKLWVYLHNLLFDVPDDLLAASTPSNNSDSSNKHNGNGGILVAYQIEAMKFGKAFVTLGKLNEKKRPGNDKLLQLSYHLVDPYTGILLRFAMEGTHNEAAQTHALLFMKELIKLYLTQNPSAPSDVFIDTYLRYTYFSFVRMYYKGVDKISSSEVEKCNIHLDTLIVFTKHQNANIRKKMASLHIMDYLAYQIYLEADLNTICSKLTALREQQKPKVNEAAFVNEINKPVPAMSSTLPASFKFAAFASPPTTITPLLTLQPPTTKSTVPSSVMAVRSLSLTNMMAAPATSSQYAVTGNASDDGSGDDKSDLFLMDSDSDDDEMLPPGSLRLTEKEAVEETAVASSSITSAPTDAVVFPGGSDIEKETLIERRKSILGKLTINTDLTSKVSKSLPASPLNGGAGGSPSKGAAHFNIPAIKIPLTPQPESFSIRAEATEKKKMMSGAHPAISSPIYASTNRSRGSAGEQSFDSTTSTPTHSVKSSGSPSMFKAGLMASSNSFTGITTTTAAAVPIDTTSKTGYNNSAVNDPVNQGQNRATTTHKAAPPTPSKNRAYYAKLRDAMKVYKNEDIHARIIIIVINLLLSCDGGGSLDPTYSEHFPTNNKKTNVPFIVQKHLNTEENDRVVVKILNEHTDSLDENGKRILKLVCCKLFNPRLYTDEMFMSQGAFGFIYSYNMCNKVVVVKKIAREDSIFRRCVIFDVYVEIGIMESHRDSLSVVNIIDYGLTGEEYWIVMEKCALSLRNWRLRHRADAITDVLPRCIEIYSQVLQAVKKLHFSGVTHYDLKCDNVLLRYDPDEYPTLPADHLVCLTDFGESEWTPNKPALLGDNFRNRGTEFMKSPEMLMVERTKKSADDCDRRKVRGTNCSSDVWSLGVLLYELITTQHLFFHDEWIQFYFRVTQNTQPVLLKEHQDIFSFDNTGAIVETIKFILNRDQKLRPPIEAVIHRWKSVAASMKGLGSTLVPFKSEERMLLASSLSSTTSAEVASSEVATVSCGELSSLMASLNKGVVLTNPQPWKVYTDSDKRYIKVANSIYCAPLSFFLSKTRLIQAVSDGFGSVIVLKNSTSKETASDTLLSDTGNAFALDVMYLDGSLSPSSELLKLSAFLHRKIIGERGKVVVLYDRYSETGGGDQHEETSSITLGNLLVWMLMNLSGMPLLPACNQVWISKPDQVIHAGSLLQLCYRWCVVRTKALQQMDHRRLFRCPCGNTCIFVTEEFDQSHGMNPHEACNCDAHSRATTCPGRCDTLLQTWNTHDHVRFGGMEWGYMAKKSVKFIDLTWNSGFRAAAISTENVMDYVEVKDIDFESVFQRYDIHEERDSWQICRCKMCAAVTHASRNDEIAVVANFPLERDGRGRHSSHMFYDKRVNEGDIVEEHRWHYYSPLGRKL